MTDLGARLRSAREEAGLTIDDLSARTKIKPAQLLAIEHGHYEQLPGEFFTRAFLRTYARELHLPVAEVMADYDRAVAPAVLQPEPPPSHSTWHTAPADFDERSGSGKIWSVLALTAVVVIAVVALNDPSPEREGESGAIGTSGAAAETAAPLGSAATTPQVPSPAETITIDIRPTRPVWVTGTADGQRVLFRQLEPGERITLEAKERFSFRVGDAGAFTFSVNGTAARPAGGDGEVREFSISRETLRSLAQ